MANIITVSMVYFPYVIAGLGQAVIVGTNSARGTVHNTAEATDRISARATYRVVVIDRIRPGGARYPYINPIGH